MAQELNVTTADHPFRIAPIVFGFCAFFANWFGSQYFNAPVAEFILLALAAQAYFSHKNFSALFSAPGFWACFGLILWIIIADAVNDTPLAAFTRELTRNIALVAPVLFFSLTPGRASVPAFCLGLLFGLGFLFNANVAWSLITLHTIPIELKWMLPTPAVFLCLYLLLRKYLSPIAKYLLLAGFISCVLFGVMVDGRGAILSLFLAGGFAVIAKILPRPALTVPSMAVFLLALHFLLTFYAPDIYGAAVRFDPESWSNLERAALIDYSSEQIDAHPFFGIGQSQFTNDFKNYFETLSHFRAMDSETALMKYEGFFHYRTGIVESPHNSFLEYSVFYGLPAGCLLLLFFWRIIHAAMMQTTRPALTAAALSMIVRHGALYGFNNIYRLEWFATMLIVLWLGGRAIKITR